MKKSVHDLIRDIESEVFYTRSYIGKEKLDARVMHAMGKVPREKFVPDDMQYAAFDNGPLPIGHGQTISQPYIVALMTDMLALQPRIVCWKSAPVPVIKPPCCRCYANRFTAWSALPNSVMRPV